MLNNISNFFSLIRGRKIKKTLVPNDMIAIGVRDTSNRADYQPSAIFFKDLKDQLGVTLTTNGLGGASSYIGGTLNIPVYQTRIPHLEWNDTEKTIWNNGLGNDSSNTGFGEGVLKSRTTGSANAGFGYLALWDTTTGSSNTAIGQAALRSNTTGGANVAVGTNALLSNTTGRRNIAIGGAALLSTITSVDNVAIGDQVLLVNNSGSYNVGIGSNALAFNTFGSSNTAVGRNCLTFNTTGGSNTAIGDSALSQNTIGSNNVVVGQFGLGGNSTGNDNTSVGWGTACPNFSGCVILGRGATASANNQFVVGSTSTNAGLINNETIAPNYTWTVRINGANYKIPLLAI